MIVLAEHDASAGSYFCRFFSERGFLVTRVDNGHDLLDVLRAVRAQLLLIDSTLPGLGDKLIPLLTKIREHFDRAALPIVLSAADEEKALMIEGLRLGVNLVLKRPYDWEPAAVQIANLLSRKKDRHPAAKLFDDVLDVVGDASLNLVLQHGPEGHFFTTAVGSVPTFPRRLAVALHADNRLFAGQTIYLKHDEIQIHTDADLPLAHTMTLVLDTLGLSLDVRETARRIEDGGTYPLRLMLALEAPPDAYTALLNGWATDKTWSESTLSVQRPADAAPPAETGADMRTQPFQLEQIRAATLTALGAHAAADAGPTGYAYVRTIGQGSFAQVYLVKDLKMGRLAAMKVLEAKIAEDESARRRFVKEARLAARFHHTNIVTVYQVGELHADDYARHLEFPKHVLDRHPQRINYITMEYVAGKTLRTWMGFHPKPDGVVVIDILAQIAQALHFSHKKGVVHRDIKPANILMTDDPHLKVADFGIAVALAGSEGAGPTGDGGVKGACTPKYASPEQLSGEACDGRSDLYSLGVMAYEMLSGAPPFMGQSLGELIDHHRHTQPAPLTCDPALSRLVLKLLAKDPADRFQDAGSLLQQLTDLRAARTDQNALTLKSNLVALVSDALVSADAADAAAALGALQKLLAVSEARGESAVVAEIRNQLCASSLINLFLDKLLKPDTQPLLRDFFTTLSSPKTVPNLLRRFKSAKDPEQAKALADFALIASADDQMLLAKYGLELPDQPASVLLSCFRPDVVLTDQPIYLVWSRHRGFRTQMMLLNLVADMHDREVELLNILNLLANADGSPHKQVRLLAGHLLQRRLLLAD